MLLALLDVGHERVTLSFGGAAERPEWFLRVNPRGLVPMLGVDGDFVWDSTAILVYLGRRFGGGSWLPADALEMARVVQWLALAQSELLHGLVRVRHITRGSRSGSIDDARRIARAGLGALEHQLAQTDWLAGATPTIADVACYPHTARAGESGFELREYPAIRAWIDRIEALPRWLPRETGAGRPWT